jgi:hypothetical protein
MFIIEEAIFHLREEGRIHIVNYRKNIRPGNSIPVYSIIPDPRTEPQLNTCGMPTGDTRKDLQNMNLY